MFKKLWLIALSTIVLWSPLLWIASADTLDWYTSEWVICKYSETTDYLTDSSALNGATCSSEVDLDWSYMKSVCFETSSLPFLLDWGYGYDYWNKTNVSISPYCINWYQVFDDWFSFYENDEDLISIPMTIYFSPSSITPPSSSAWDSDWSISVPSWFTDSVNWLVSNFAWSIWNYAPTLIIIWLGVVLLFTFWWVIRSWAVRILSKKWR